MFRPLYVPPDPDRARPVACVTGGAENIGHAVARRLADDGFQIVTTVLGAAGSAPAPGDPTTTTAAAGTALGQESGWAVAECDLSRSPECRELTSFIESRFGRLDCLVNNAATWTYSRLTETTDEQWRHVLEVNVVAIARLSRDALPLLRRSPAPRVVNVGSSCGFLPEAGVGPYCVSKAAVHALTRWLAIELADDGILVNAVAPGFIQTTTNAPYFEDERALARRLESIPVGRPGKVQEIAHVVAFLASPRLGFVTGEVIRCDGGFLSGMSERLMSSHDLSFEQEEDR